MSTHHKRNVVAFWSWQADEPAEASRNFVFSCLEKALARLQRSEGAIYEADRDTKNVSGMPGIAETIFAKIARADVFVFDATLSYTAQRADSEPAAPNPNVMLETGFALASIGEGRLIGVMNTAKGRKANQLPFDLLHRRWPIEYNLPARSDVPDGDWASLKKEVAGKLTEELYWAVASALEHGRFGTSVSSVDRYTAEELWKAVRPHELVRWCTRYEQTDQWYSRYALDHVGLLREELARKAGLTFREERLEMQKRTFIKAVADCENVIAKNVSSRAGADADLYYPNSIQSPASIAQAAEAIWRAWDALGESSWNASQNSRRALQRVFSCSC